MNLIKDIIKVHKKALERHIISRDHLRNKNSFCLEHGFNEESRILTIKLNSFQDVIYDFRELINNLEKYLVELENSKIETENL